MTICDLKYTKPAKRFLQHCLDNAFLALLNFEILYNDSAKMLVGHCMVRFVLMSSNMSDIFRSYGAMCSIESFKYAVKCLICVFMWSPNLQRNCE